MLGPLVRWLTPKDPFERRMRVALLRSMALSQRGALLTMPLSAAGLAAVGLIWTNAGVLLAWYLALLATIALAFLTKETFIKSNAKPEEAGRWTLRIIASLVPNFIVLPAIVPLLWVHGDVPNNILLTVFMLISLPMAAMFYGAWLPIGLASILKFSPLLMLYPVTEFASQPWIAQALYLTFTGVNCGIAVGVHRAARSTALLQFHNEELLQEVASARVRAERANETKSIFLANMSHELRTPLNGIMGFSEMITLGAPKYLEYAASIHESGKHLLSLINDILDLAKIEAGKIELADTDVDIRKAAEEAVTFVERQAATGGVGVRIDIAGRPILIADKRAILQIICNLLSNAVKFTPPGGQVSVFAGVTNENFVLGVKDTGHGMTKEELKKAVEPYGQTSLDMLTVEGRGTGLGLPIVKALIEAHMGLFRIESAPGAGTRVWGEFAQNRIATAKAA